jgi:hypothetical protein
MPITRVSFNALRFSGRDSRRKPISPSRSAVIEAGRFGMSILVLGVGPRDGLSALV